MNNTYKYRLEGLNLELTTYCPLHCPQCYCTLNTGEHLNFEIAKQHIASAVEIGLKQLNLSGGETLCYPQLFELIAFAHNLEVEVAVALSGAYFSQTVFEQLQEAGIDEICISLNGSTEEINSLTRDGYALAIKALEILKANEYKRTTLNWVMHSNNADDFINVVHLAEVYGVNAIDIIGLKPDSKNQLQTLPTLEQIRSVSNIAKNYSGPVKIAIESCFSNMLALHLDTRLFGNINFGLDKGCTAGRSNMSVNVKGQFTPCRHIEYTEDFQDLKEYWEKSEALSILRSIEENKKEPCSSCYYSNYCRHCQAISWNMHHQFFIGFDSCAVYKAK